VKKSGSFDAQVFLSIVEVLQSGKNLSGIYLNHKLQGDFKECYECHIKPNLLLIYKIEHKDYALHLLRIGSHSDLFG
jgi:mRNA interferase YafQ